MYKVKEVEISNFWHRLNAKSSFNEDVNIIIGRNGTGKTTFMNILHAALTVDLEELAENDFSEVVIRLSNGSNNRIVRVKKSEGPVYNFQEIEYKISNRKYQLKAFLSSDEVRIPMSIKKRFLEESGVVRKSLSELISLSSLSVYRLKNSEEFEVKDRSGKRLISPVDFRLMQLRSEITKYQFELSMKARDVSAELQRDVLASILYTDGPTNGNGIPTNFEKEKEQEKLVTAYRRLNAYDGQIKGKISSHVSAISESIKLINSERHQDLSEKHFAAIDAFFRTQSIVDLSLRAEEKTLKIFSQISLFTGTLKEFIPDKSVRIVAGELKVFNLEDDEIPISKLSSGEKQLIILLAEALLQKGQHYVYLADEPELSLHIAWQRKILPAIKKLNPNAQIIAATHSPEVASKYSSALIDMKDIVNA